MSTTIGATTMVTTTSNPVFEGIEMAKKNAENLDYGGRTIELDSSKRFRVVDLDRSYDTYQQAVAAIDRAEAQEKAVAKKKLSISVVDGNGTPTTITGIHSGNGNITTTPKTSNYANLYPAEPWISEAIKLRDELKEKAANIDSVLLELRIASVRSYGDFNLVELTDELEKNAASAIAKAKKTNLQTELDKLAMQPKKRRIF